MNERVALLTTEHLDRTGIGPGPLGRQRYAFALTRLLQDLGYEPEWWQAGGPWQRELLPGVALHAIPQEELPYQTMPILNQIFFEQAVDCDFAIYFELHLAYPTVLRRSLAVCHGVYWDQPGMDRHRPAESGRAEWQRRLELAVGGVQRVVAADTASLDWLRAAWPTLAGKCLYLPNFVDTDEFQPLGGDAPTRPFRILFPREPISVRGINAAGQAALALTAAHKDLEVHFCGRTRDEETELRLARWAGEHPRLFFYRVPAERMPELYRQAALAWFPSTSCQGTSFACLEAMASGCPVIATAVGGLSDLVQHEHSGLLIEPTVAALVEATERLYRDQALAARLARNARAVAESFALPKWRLAWTQVLRETFPQPA